MEDFHYYLNPHPQERHYIARSTIIAALKKLAPTVKGRMIDIGSGPLRGYEDLFKAYVSEYLCIDRPSVENVDIGADCYNIPLPNASVDTILSTQVLEHLVTPDRMLKESYRLLKAGGSLILTAPMVWGLHEEPFDFYRYTEHGLRSLLEQAGYVDIAIHPLEGLFAVLLQMFIDEYHVGWSTKNQRLATLMTGALNRLALWLELMFPTRRLCLTYLAVATKPAEDSRDRSSLFLPSQVISEMPRSNNTSQLSPLSDQRIDKTMLVEELSEQSEPSTPISELDFTGERYIPALAGVDLSLWNVDHMVRYAFVSAFIKDKRVLDISCGSGYGSRYLALQGAQQVVGVDVDERSIQFASKFYQHPAVSFIQSDAHAIQSLKDASFDVIVSFETIEHLQNPRQFLLELRRLLKPDGQLFISCPNDYRVSPGVSEFHLHKFRFIEFRDLYLSIFSEGVFVGQHLTVASCIMKPYAPGLKDVQFGAHHQPLPSDFFTSQYLEHLSSIENADNYIAVLNVDESLIGNQASISQQAYQVLMQELCNVSAARVELERLRSQLQSVEATLVHSNAMHALANERIQAMESSKFWQLRKLWFWLKRKTKLGSNG
ncbi:MAG: methyltransferase domain-containing protein [Stenomitos rutilans HA7619-LM2]|jgi:2-polyprenyl-3-methyl-5-hydroxy-6-metoxy-1,4-benzoquinol methylase|nr:methyltransferase domain-containing protein [Stenomitos rutilans HA7619-LM2]